MLLVYRQDRDEILPITRAWITSENEIYGMTPAGNQMQLAEYDTDTQAQDALDRIFDQMPGPKVEMPKSVANIAVPKEEVLEDKCHSCAYNSDNLTAEENQRFIQDPTLDPCETCIGFSKYKEKDRS